jgi:hypothetical protein
MGYKLEIFKALTLNPRQKFLPLRFYFSGRLIDKDTFCGVEDSPLVLLTCVNRGFHLRGQLTVK